MAQHGDPLWRRPLVAPGAALAVILMTSVGWGAPEPIRLNALGWQATGPEGAPVLRVELAVPEDQQGRVEVRWPLGTGGARIAQAQGCVGERCTFALTLERGAQPPLRPPLQLGSGQPLLPPGQPVKWRAGEGLGLVGGQLTLSVPVAAQADAPDALLVPLEHPAVALALPAGTSTRPVACDLDGDTLDRCGVAQPMGPDGQPPALRLDVKGNKRLARAIETGQGHLTVTLPLPEGVELQVGDNVAQSRLTLDLSVARCSSRLVQLTTARAGLSQGEVLYRLAEGAGRCPVPTGGIQAVGGDGQSELSLSARAVPGRPGLVKLAFQSLPEVWANQTLRLKGIDGASADQGTLEIAEPVTFSLVDVQVPRPALEGEAAGPPGQLSVRDQGHLMVGRPNLIEVQASVSGRWSAAPTGAPYLPCEVAPDEAGASGRISACVRPVRATEPAEPLTLALSLRGAARDLAHTSALGDAALSQAMVGDLPVVAGTVLSADQWASAPWTARPLRLGFDLADRVALRCGSGDPVSAADGVKAVPYDAVERCALVVRLDGAAARGCDALETAEEKAFCRFRALLGAVGPQRLEVSLSRYEGQPPTFVPQSVEGRLPLALTLEAEAPPPVGPAEEGQVRLGRPRLVGDEVQMALDLTQAGALSLEEYDLVRIEVRHAEPESLYPESLISRPDSVAQITVRRMPARWNWQGERPGRVYFTLPVLPALFRWPHSDQSQPDDRLERVGFGLGVLAVGELWNFDQNTPLMGDLNLQAHLGLLSSLTYPLPDEGDLDVPSVSLVVGLGAKLPPYSHPGGVSAPVEKGLFALLWYERRLIRPDGEQANAVLFGLGAQFFSGPN